MGTGWRAPHPEKQAEDQGGVGEGLPGSESVAALALKGIALERPQSGLHAKGRPREGDASFLPSMGGWVLGGGCCGLGLGERGSLPSFHCSPSILRADGAVCYSDGWCDAASDACFSWATRELMLICMD